MNTNELEKAWSPLRVALLLRNHLLGEAPLAGIGFGIVGGLGLLDLVINHRASWNSPGNLIWTGSILLLGLLFAGRSFQAMHGGRATEWLLLPATGGEKYLAVLVAVLVVWPLASILACMVLSALLGIIAMIAGWAPGNLWIPFRAVTGRALVDYLSFAPVLVAGSTFFRKHAILRTLGTIVGLVTALAMAFTIIMFIVSGGHGASFTFNNWNLGLSGGTGRQRIVQGLLDAWRFAVIPGFALAFGWFRIAEKEAKDAVQ